MLESVKNMGMQKNNTQPKNSMPLTFFVLVAKNQQKKKLFIFFKKKEG